MTTDHDEIGPADTTEARLLIHPPLRRPFGQGMTWVSEAWSLFTRNWGLWIGGLLVLWLITLVIGFLPLLGPLLQIVAAPVVYAGFYEVARKADYDQRVVFDDFFNGFRFRTGELIRLGLVNLAAFVLVLVAGALMLWLLLGGSETSAMMTMWMEMGTGEQPSAGMMTNDAAWRIALAGLVFAALTIPYVAAIWFATPLVLFGDGVRPLQAYGMSLRACLKNILPMLLYSLIALVLMLVVGLTFGIGMIVVFPLLVISAYTSFHDIFVTPENSRFA